MSRDGDNNDVKDSDLSSAPRDEDISATAALVLLLDQSDELLSRADPMATVAAGVSSKSTTRAAGVEAAPKMALADEAELSLTS